KQILYDTEDIISKDKILLEELSSIKTTINTFEETEDFELLKGNVLGLNKSNINLPSKPIAPSRKTSPSNTKNAAIGGMFGCIIGAFIVLIKEYWFKKN
ncbi:MAG: hypothetical protein WBI07_18020, partial [Mobilitalea sp.]